MMPLRETGDRSGISNGALVEIAGAGLIHEIEGPALTLMVGGTCYGHSTVDALAAAVTERAAMAPCQRGTGSGCRRRVKSLGGEDRT